MVGVPLDDLLDEVWVGGLQVRAGWLIELKLKAPPQLRHVEGMVPAAAHLGGEGPVQQRQVLEYLEQDLLGQAAPVRGVLVPLWIQILVLVLVRLGVFL